MAEELLRLEGVTRRITSEFYIREVDLTVTRGEVLALAGKNAAGKTTLTGIINGLLPAESGRIFFEGKPVKLDTTSAALELGIVTLMQNNRGFENMSVAENVLFGNPQYYKNGNLSNHRLEKICGECFDKLGIAANPAERFCNLMPAQKQAAAIARAYLFAAKLIIMDEPSSHLPQRDCEMLYHVIRQLREDGISVIYITHRLSEILALADRVAIVEHGEIKEIRAVAGLTEMDLIESIEGFRVEDIYQRQPTTLGEPVLEVKNLSALRVEELTLTLHSGEILAVLGEDASAASLYRALLGLEKYTGEVRVLGNTVQITNPLQSNALRIVPAVDEETEAMLRNYDSRGGKKTGWLSLISAKTRNMGENLGKTLGGLVTVQHKGEYITGGYRQKELVLRATARDGDIYVLVDPVNGIDLQTKLRVYGELRKLTKRGKGILYVTNDPDEAIGLADRVLVLQKGRVTFDAIAKETDRATLAKLVKE